MATSVSLPLRSPWSDDLFSRDVLVVTGAAVEHRSLRSCLHSIDDLTEAAVTPTVASWCLKFKKSLSSTLMKN